MDIVYTYVDDSDPIWKANKEKYMETDLNKNINNSDTFTHNRYYSRDELKYSLRSLEKNLPFIRNIYIITDNQKPKWFHETDRLKIIDHKDIIKEEYLPTYNSHVIEANIHKINGISNIFMYMNDDIFFGHPLNEDDFYKDGLISVFLDKSYTRKGIPNVNEYAFRSAWKNVNIWLDKNFQIERRRKMLHTPSVIFKDVMFTLWDKLQSELSLTCFQKFRSIIDYSITCSLHPYYCIYSDKAIINKDLTTKTLYLSSDIINDSFLLEELYQNIPHIFCLEDDIHDSYIESDNIIKSFLEKCFPYPSSFELELFETQKF